MDVLNIQSPGAIERANPEGVKHMDVLNKSAGSRYGQHSRTASW